MSGPEARAANEDALKDLTVDITPQPIGEYTFLHDKVNEIREELEEETETKFTTYKAILFLKRDFHYTIRVDVGGGQVIDVKMNKGSMTNFSVKKPGDEMKL